MTTLGSPGRTRSGPEVARSRSARSPGRQYVTVGGGHLLTAPSPRRPPVNRSLPLSTRTALQRARSHPIRRLDERVRVLSGAHRDHAADVARAQNPANAGAFKAKPRESPRGAPVNCATTFGWWWRKNGSPISRRFKRGGVVLERTEEIPWVAALGRAREPSVKRRAILSLLGMP